MWKSGEIVIMLIVHEGQILIVPKQSDRSMTSQPFVILLLQIIEFTESNIIYRRFSYG